MYLEKTVINSKSRLRGNAYFVNFLIIISQSVAFSVLSFYKHLYPSFFTIFIIILFIDVLGFGILTTTEETKVLYLQVRWLINGFLSAVILSFVNNPNIVGNPEISFWLSIMVVGLNTIVGFTINWHLYSPARQRS
jgi:hypothetical protein